MKAMELGKELHGQELHVNTIGQEIHGNTLRTQMSKQTQWGQLKYHQMRPDKEERN